MILKKEYKISKPRTKKRISQEIVNKYIKYSRCQKRKPNKSNILIRFMKSALIKLRLYDELVNNRNIKTVNETTLYEKDKSEIPEEFIGNYRDNGKFYFFDIRELYIFYINRFNTLDITNIINPYTNTNFNKIVSKRIYERLRNIDLNSREYLRDMLEDLSEEQLNILDINNIFQIVKSQTGYYLDVNNYIGFTTHILFNFYEHLRVNVIWRGYIPSSIHNAIISAYYTFSLTKLRKEMNELFDYMFSLDVPEDLCFIFAESYLDYINGRNLNGIMLLISTAGRVRMLVEQFEENDTVYINEYEEDETRSEEEDENE
jgi:hypothetical protein